MKRPTFVNQSALICGLVAVPGMVCVLEEADAADSVRPNIVFILADDPGYRELGSFGQQKMPTLTGRDQPQRPFLYREFPGYGGQQTIRVGDWKAVRQGMARGNINVELYNVSTDIGEQHNVADEHADVVESWGDAPGWHSTGPLGLNSPCKPGHLDST